MLALLQCFTSSIIHGKSFFTIIHESVDGAFYCPCATNCAYHLDVYQKRRWVSASTFNAFRSQRFCKLVYTVK